MNNFLNKSLIIFTIMISTFSCISKSAELTNSNTTSGKSAPKKQNRLPQAKDFFHKNINYIDKPQVKIPAVYYHGNGNTSGTVPETRNLQPNINGFFFEPTRLPQNLMKKGFIFTGWNTKADGSGMHYEIDLEESNTFTDINAISFKDLHLYAEWEPVTPQKIKMKGGTINHTIYLNALDTITQQRTVSDFSIGRYEITNHQWYGVTSWALQNGYSLPKINKYLKNGTLYLPSEIRYEPVTRMEWLETVIWCNALSEMNGLQPVYLLNNQILKSHNISKEAKSQITADWKADGFRLPTATEWEYTARYIDGKKFLPGEIISTFPRSPYYKPFSAETEFLYNINDYGWFKFGDDRTPEHPVGLKKPNKAGTFDMLGNVSEWCWDIEGATRINPPDNSPVTDYRGADLANIRNPRRTVMGKHYKNFGIHQISLGWNHRTHGYGLLSRVGFRIASSSNKTPKLPVVQVQQSKAPIVPTEQQQIQQLGGLPINWNTIKLLTYFPWLNQFAPNTEYTITVGTAEEAQNWLIKLYIEKPDKTGLTVIDFPPQRTTRRTASFRTSGYIPGEETGHYFEVHIPGSDNVYRYGVKGDKPAWFFLTTNAPKLKQIPHVLPFEDAEQRLSNYFSFPEKMNPVYQTPTPLKIQGSAETSSWTLNMSYRKPDNRNAELVKFTNSNGIFTATANTNFLPGEKLLYNFYVGIPGEKAVKLFTKDRETVVLSNITEKYSMEEILKQFKFQPLNDITRVNRAPYVIQHRRPDPFCYYIVPEGIQRWSFDLFYRVKGLDEQWHSSNSIRATNPSKYDIITRKQCWSGKKQYSFNLSSLEYGDVVEYYFYLKIFDTNQEFHIFKDNPLSFKMDWNKTSPSNITDLYRQEPIQFIKAGHKLDIIIATAASGVDTTKYNCSILYKTTGQSTYTAAVMNKAPGGLSFRQEISTANLRPEDEILYYFVFTLPDGTKAEHGSSAVPYRIRVVEKYPPMF